MSAAADENTDVCPSVTLQTVTAETHAGFEGEDGVREEKETELGEQCEALQTYSTCIDPHLSAPRTSY